ncbi:MAG: hypothetical protein ACM3ML_09245 [Micromonosporaceae bacterium]
MAGQTERDGASYGVCDAVACLADAEELFGVFDGNFDGCGSAGVTGVVP